LTKKYSIIIEKFFSKGIYVYDKDEIETFKTKYIKTFNDNKLPHNDRALISRMLDSCILCGRGKYKIKQDKYITNELNLEIYNYIMNSDKEIFLTNTLFYIFEDRLISEGVDNKYYLQGILRASYGNTLFF
jgi:hypothetical protein